MDRNEIETALAAGTAAAAVQTVQGTPLLVIPAGYGVHTLENLLPAPARHSGTAELLDATSFINYVNDIDGAGDRVAEGTTRMYYVIEPHPEFIVVFNDSHQEVPAWRDWRAVYRAPLSREWQTWTKNDKVKMGQTDFASFIEQNLPDITKPTGAEMLEIASSLQANKGVNWASGIRLSNGQVQFKYQETIEARAGQSGTLDVPEVIEIVAPVFDGSPVADRLTARFRYRISNEGGLSMWYELDRPHKVLEVATEDLRKLIESGTNLAGLKGRPAK